MRSTGGIHEMRPESVYSRSALRKDNGETPRAEAETRTDIGFSCCSVPRQVSAKDSVEALVMDWLSRINLS